MDKANIANRSAKAGPSIKMHYSRLKASPMAEETAEVNKNIAMTSDFMFLGAFVNAYSRPVIDARISENAMRT
jgi:hypothetical protein